MKRRGTGAYLLGALLFVIPTAVSAVLGILLYDYALQKSGKVYVAVLSVALTVVFLATLWTIVDLLRRRVSIDKPMEKILSATEKIAAGDFSVRIRPSHRYGKYDFCDLVAENLNLMAAELQKSEILKNDFISNVSHELKTPLTVIKSYAELLLVEKDKEKQAEYAKTIVSASSRLSGLVTDILQLNKLENQRILPDKGVFRLDEVLGEALVGFEPLTEKKGIELFCDLQELCVNSSKNYLEIVFNNLISNAVKFTDEGGRVEVNLYGQDKNAVVSVKDTGCGIPAQEGMRIFDKFYQADRSRSGEGNGLGLALVKKVIDVLGGEISVRSEVGKGTTFTVILKDALV